VNVIRGDDAACFSFVIMNRRAQAGRALAGGRPGGPGKDLRLQILQGDNVTAKVATGPGDFKIVGRFRRISPKTTHDHGRSPWTLAVQPL